MQADAKKAGEAKAAQDEAEGEKAKEESNQQAPPTPTEAADVTVRLNIKSNVSGEGSKTVDVKSVEITVMELHEEIAKQLSVPVNQQRLIFSGRVCKAANRSPPLVSPLVNSFRHHHHQSQIER